MTPKTVVIKSRYNNTMNKIIDRTNYSKTIHYDNQSPLCVGMIERSGLTNVFPARSFSAGDFVVFTRYRFYSTNLPQSLQEIITRCEERSEMINPNGTLSLVVNQIKMYLRTAQYHNGPVEIELIKEISKQKLLEEGAIYLPDEDIVVCDVDVLNKTKHPLSDEQTTLAYVEQLRKHQHTSGVLVRIIDNENCIGKRYFAVNNTLLEVEPVKDPHKHSGVEVTTMTSEDGELKTTHKVHTLEEASTALGLWKTKEEARTAGDPKQLHNEEIERLRGERIRSERDKLESDRKKLEADQELARLKAELELQKANNERIKMDLDAAALKFKMDMEASAARRKEYYEERSYDRSDHYESRSQHRKDSSETWKYVGGGLLAAVTCFTAYQRYKGN